MSTPFAKRLNTSEIVEDTLSLCGHEPEDVNSAASNLSTSVTSEDVARQITAAVDPMTKQLERLCDII